MNKTAVIIGSGFGALSLAIRLQAKGIQTTIFEKNEMAGGHAYQFKEKGYTFDMGPSLITEPDIIQRVFASAGKKMEDYLEISKLDPYYRVYFHDKTFIDYNGDMDKMQSQIAKFNKKDAENYPKFLKYSSKLYKTVITDGLGSKPFVTAWDFISFIPRAVILKAILPAYFMTTRYFKDFRTRFLFSFHTLFIGGNPFRAPSLFLMLPYLEKAEGVWFSKGGMYSLVEAFVKLFTELGGKLVLNSEVEEIIIKDNKAVGIISKGQEYYTDIIVSNAHFANTYMNLIPKEKRKKFTDKKIKSKAYSMSSFLIYLGVKKQYPELLHHTLILSERYKELIKDIFDKKILAKDFSMYLHVPTRTDSSMAPENSESMYLLIPVPNLQAEINWEVESEKYTKRILDFMENDFGLTDLQKNIEVIRTFSPLDFQNVRNNYLGAAWSLEPSLFQIANFRPHNRSEEFKNLYLVGVSTHPGGGVPGVLLTAETTEKLILQDLERK